MDIVVPELEVRDSRGGIRIGVKRDLAGICRSPPSRRRRRGPFCVADASQLLRVDFETVSFRIGPENRDEQFGFIDFRLNGSLR
jgi:hypothetical protein